MRFVILRTIALSGLLLFYGCDSHKQSNKELVKPATDDIATLVSYAEKGDIDSQFALGVKYHLGDGVEVDMAKAAYWYLKASNMGHLGAKSNLAALYYDGKGVQQDYRKAIELYQQISDAGDVSGTTSLAGMYLDGKGVVQNYQEAKRLFLIAAEHGYAYAQTAIGIMYKFGWGVPQDNIEAYAWLILGANNSDKYAIDNMKKLEQTLSPSDINLAQDRSKLLFQQKQNTDCKINEN